MTELSWSELFPPRDLALADVTATMRILAGRPRRGVQRLTPIVVFELWLRPGRVRWLLGMDTSCLLYTSPSPRDRTRSRMPSSA